MWMDEFPEVSCCCCWVKTEYFESQLSRHGKITKYSE